MNYLQKVQQRARTPGLSLTRVGTRFSILIRQLWQSSPRIGLDMMPRSEKNAMKIMKALLGILKNNQSGQQISHVG
jgi:hypothetical protein